ncbi:MAG: VWA domain-containing protein [Candidatus Aminicenantes bacterium]|nr:VWA domain-containing protein [Candidatus Aminicenantes bacterium]
MKLRIVVLLLAGLMVFTIHTAGKVKKERPLVQMAILLDTSGSMEGLIEQSKTQLWKIVNEMALAKREGLSPRLEVGLYEYGKDSIPKSEGFLRMIVPLSEDLDRISEELFKLKTNGGSEYCGKVIQSAANELNWSKRTDEFKVIFIAGNEPFTQGEVDYKIACKEAISKGIIVNTIFCGDYESGIRTFWKEGADLADGKYMNIDHNRKIVHIPAPQDQKIIDLGKNLNKTYVAYGKGGSAKKERQRRQDKNALSMSEEAMVQRAAAKSTAQYKNVAWDIVDAEKEGTIKIEDIKEEDLPEEMRKMSIKERKEYIEKLKKEREEIQKKIQQLKKERDKYVAEKRKKMAGENTLDTAMITAIREQAKKKNFKFEKK